MAKRKKTLEPAIVRQDGALCVAFANSASRKRRDFATYAELLALGVTLGVLDAADVERLERCAVERPEAARAVARRALILRSGLRRLLKALADCQSLPAPELEALNQELALALSARRLIANGTGCRMDWGDRGGDELDRVLWRVVSDAADLLCGKLHRRIGRCAGERCDLLFVDRTGGSPRKWCSMDACGNRVKALRDYHRRIKPERKRRDKRLRAELEQRSAARQRAAAEQDSLRDP